MRQSGVLPHFYNFCLKKVQARRDSFQARQSWFYCCLLLLISSFLGTFLTAEVQAIPLQESTPDVVDASVSQDQSPRPSNPLLSDGIYFYGEAPIPDELGHSYMVFEAQGERIVGAIYMPFSSFDCFRGELTAAALNLEITNSYTQEVYAYAIAAAASDPIASELGGPLTPLTLQNFYNLGDAREADLALLQTCQVELQPGVELEI